MNKRMILLLSCLFTVSSLCCACNKSKNNEVESFSLTWGCYGVSSYNSALGNLIKTSDTTNVDEYTTTLILSDKQMQQVEDILNKIDLSKYPSEYNPQNGYSEPSMTLILTVNTEEKTYKIACEDISLLFGSSDSKGQEFLDTCNSIIELITNTDEWKALPDYEVIYK